MCQFTNPVSSPPVCRTCLVYSGYTHYQLIAAGWEVHSVAGFYQVTGLPSPNVIFPSWFLLKRSTPSIHWRQRLAFSCLAWIAALHPQFLPVVLYAPHVGAGPSAWPDFACCLHTDFDNRNWARNIHLAPVVWDMKARGLKVSQLKHGSDSIKCWFCSKSVTMCDYSHYERK